MPLDVVGKYRYPPPNPRWLAQHVEVPLEPDLPIIDAHHHLWREPGNPYLLPDLVADIGKSGHRIVATVYAQAHHAYRTTGAEHLRPVGETEAADAARIAARQAGLSVRVCEGIIAYADLLDLERLDEVLDAHTAASPAFRGIRQSVARDSHFPDGIVLRPAPAGMLADERMREGVRRLGRRGLSFDALLYHEQIPDLAALALETPETTIILNHYGCPIGVGPYKGHEAERFAIWRSSIRDLSRCPNVIVKLGGLGMIVTGACHHLRDRPPESSQLSEEWKPWLDTCIEAFGTRRCMLEGNFPVDKAMYSYGVMWNAFKRATFALSAAERSELFSRTAASTYRLRFC